MGRRRGVRPSRLRPPACFSTTRTSAGAFRACSTTGAAALERAGRLRPESSLANFDIHAAPELRDEECPYFGLNAFQEKDSRVFFGRDALVQHLVEKLERRARPLVAIVGPSGCGKSSLALAGLLSRARRRGVAGSDIGRVLTTVPGANPWADLTKCLADDRERSAEVGGTMTTPVLLVLDQFEELFTLCRSEDERSGFLNDLLAIIRARPRIAWS
jgi:hypothetical protein